MKYVTRLNGHRVTRPAANHPCPEHWQGLRERVIELQSGVCGTCAIEPGAELHHRHYDNWGCELLDDVILLCRACHEAITSRIRAARYAAGDRSIELNERIEHSYLEIYRPAERIRVKLEPEPEQDYRSSTFRRRFL